MRLRHSVLLPLSFPAPPVPERPSDGMSTRPPVPSRAIPGAPRIGLPPEATKGIRACPEIVPAGAIPTFPILPKLIDEAVRPGRGKFFRCAQLAPEFAE